MWSLLRTAQGLFCFFVVVVFVVVEVVVGLVSWFVLDIYYMIMCYLVFLLSFYWHLSLRGDFDRGHSFMVVVLGAVGFEWWVTQCGA